MREKGKRFMRGTTSTNGILQKKKKSTNGTSCSKPSEARGSPQHSVMAEPSPPSQSPAQTPPQQQASAAGGREDMLACVAAMEAALLPCLPARELQAVDRSLQSAHQIDVERHARDFMEAAKKLQSYFISLQREDPPTTQDMLRKEITTMEEELKTKAELIAKHKKLIEGWQKELKEQLGKHITELERV